MATVCTESTANVATEPSLRVTDTRSPARSRGSCLKTPSPYLPTVTWPRITDGPVWPGVGEPSYQPAGACAAIGGTATSPSASSPRDITAVSTPISGMRSRSGSERAMARTATGCGAAAVVPGDAEDTAPLEDGSRAGAVGAQPQMSVRAAEVSAIAVAVR